MTNPIPLHPANAKELANIAPETGAEVLRDPSYSGCWQTTSAGEREVRKALRKTLFKFKLHQETELFDKAYGYIKQYY